jgi:hypothetical protein
MEQLLSQAFPRLSDLLRRNTDITSPGMLNRNERTLERYGGLPNSYADIGRHPLDMSIGIKTYGINPQEGI